VGLSFFSFYLSVVLSINVAGTSYNKLCMFTFK